MHLLVDRNVPLAEDFFGELGEVTRIPGREISAEHVRDKDALIVRSTTRVNADLLEGSRVRFVATCTIGTDHVDLDYLKDKGIGFASAPGSNAESVNDYVLASLMTLAQSEGVPLTERKVGILGAGNVGGRVWQRLAALGIDCLVCDPPRAEREARNDFVGVDALIEQCDVLCIHTPLVREGKHPTTHLLDATRIDALARGTWLVSAGRGECVDNDALHQRLTRRGDLRTVLDVWEGEPACDPGLMTKVDIATPHIAGHSLDGKMRGTEMAYQALVTHFGLPARHSLASLQPGPWLREITLDSDTPPLGALSIAIRACYDIRRDMSSFLRYVDHYGTSTGFDCYRSEYPVRREFSTVSVRLVGGEADHSLRALLEAAGFNVPA